MRIDFSKESEEELRAQLEALRGHRKRKTKKAATTSREKKIKKDTPHYKSKLAKLEAEGVEIEEC